MPYRNSTTASLPTSAPKTKLPLRRSTQTNQPINHFLNVAFFSLSKSVQRCALADTIAFYFGMSR
jgi:hypothetical protein